MKTRFVVAVLLAALAAMLLTGSGLAGGGGPGPATRLANQSPYYSSLVETLNGLGDQLSMARDPLNGRIYIAYYDPALGALRLAAQAAPGKGNCGSQGWYCATLDAQVGGVRVGLTPSIAVYRGQFGMRVGVAYTTRDGAATAGPLKYAEFYASPSTLFSVNPAQWNWKVVQVDNKLDDHPSLQFDTLGAPHIAFERNQGSSATITHAMPLEGGTDIGCTVDAPYDQWYCENIVSANVGHLPSLGIGVDNVPRIAFYYSYQTTHILEFAIRDNTAAGDVCGENYWKCSSIKSAQINNVALKVYSVNGGSYSHIAYIDNVDDQVKYAMYVSANSIYANCGPTMPKDWMCDTVADAGPHGDPNLHKGIAIDVERTGYPLIAYERAEEQAPSSLYLAQEVPGPAKNCLNQTSGKVAWACNAIAVPSTIHVSMGLSTGMAIDPNGLGAIAYLSDDDYYNTTSVNLAYQKSYVFLPLMVTP